MTWTRATRTLGRRSWTPAIGRIKMLRSRYLRPEPRLISRTLYINLFITSSRLCSTFNFLLDDKLNDEYWCYLNTNPTYFPINRCLKCGIIKKDGRTALHEVCRSPSNKEEALANIAKKLIEFGCDVNLSSSSQVCSSLLLFYTIAIRVFQKLNNNNVNFWLF